MIKTRCNIRDLAKAAGLSAGTVSRILNNRPENMKIPEQTRRRVIKLAREMQYVPNVHAKRLFSRQSGVIGLVIPSIGQCGGPVFGNSHFSHIIAGMEEHLNASSRHIELIINNQPFKENRSFLSLFQDGSIDGLLVWGTCEAEVFWQELIDARFPYVFIGGYPRLKNWVNCVMNDEAYAAGVMTEHILRAGHRRILFLEDSAGCSPAWHRIYGINAALTNQALPKECVRISGKSVESALDEARADGFEFTAAITTNFHQAEQLRNHGVSLGCCSVFSGEAAAWPELVRVENDNAAIGLEAVQAIEKIIDASDPFLVNRAIPGHFIEGNTIQGRETVE